MRMVVRDILLGYFFMVNGFWYILKDMADLFKVSHILTDSKCLGFSVMITTALFVGITFISQAAALHFSIKDKTP